MKKDKNTELKKKDTLKRVADGTQSNTKKVKKPKNKAKKVKELAATIVGGSGTDLVKDVKAENAAAPVNGAKSKKNKNSNKKNKDAKDPNNVKTEENGKKEEVILDPSERAAAKIAKKKAKKSAQKLKKQQKKANGSTESKGEKKDSTDKKKKVTPEKKKKPETKILKVEKLPKKERDPKAVAKKQLKAEKKAIQKQEPKEHHPRDAAADAATVFVGNLPINTKRVQLVRLFKDYAPVNAVRFRTAGGKTIFKHKHRKEAGALNAYVLLKDAETATKALSLNGFEFKGNHLRVTKSDMNAHNRVEADAKNMIFVGNLKYSATEDKLREIFSSCGDIEYVRCLRDGEKGCKGVAYVCFKAPDAVGLALELNETVLDERPIHVERYSVKKLGAKQARDESSTTVENKSKTGARKRVDDKKRKGGPAAKAGGVKKPSTDSSDKKKKSEFRGVKVDNLKKKQKKKKPTSQMQQLAKKIAPKSE